MSKSKFSQIFSPLFSFMQKLGQALMVPVSVLPAAGLTVAIGRALQMTSSDPKAQTFVTSLGKVFYSGGLAVFEQLPVIFAIGVAIGFTGGAGIAGLSAAAGYFTLINLLKVFGEIRALELPINMGVFGGILIGGLAAYLYNRFHKVELPKIFGFFSGKRFIPILTVGSTLILGVGLAYFWPPIQVAISDFGHLVTQSQFGAAFYAAGKRMLIPVGLHHVYYPSFLYDFGSFTNAAGEVFKGDSTRYYAGDPNAGIFMAAEFPIMLFGLPAAALAIVMRARPERRKAIAGIMMTAALTSILTGITEPIEFAFIFVAPLLYLAHVTLAFMSGILTSIFDIHLGYTFSASLIDFVLGYFNQKNSLYLWLVVGPIIAISYFVIFYFGIGWFDYKTPGRTEETEDQNSTVKINNGSSADKAKAVLVALGGANNIKQIDACITRLRTTLVDSKLVDQAQLKKLGSSGVLDAGGGNVQIIFGTESDRLKDEIKYVMAQELAETKTESFVLNSPIKGEIVALENVPDQVFSQKMMGDGFAVYPSQGLVVAPADAEVLNVFPTGHALGLKIDKYEVLIHIGIDTVKMKGDGFTILCKEGDFVKAGSPLIKFDIEKIKNSGKSVLTPIVITNLDEQEEVQITQTGLFIKRKS